MRANSWGKYFGFSTFGESHGPAIGILIEDVRPGEEFPIDRMRALLAERRPKNRYDSARSEADDISILSGVFEGKTTGMPICLLIHNKEQDSDIYERIRGIFRPGHADLSYFEKFKIYDHRGGGRASGRETVARVAASALVEKMLGEIEISCYPIQIGKIKAAQIDHNFRNELNWPDPHSFNNLKGYLDRIKASGDSIGGIVECIIQNVPAGLGDPVFEKLDANLAKALLSIGSIKAIEFGSGFNLAEMTGSQANDQIDKDRFKSNHAGGILGGISTGQQIVMRLAVKPTPSITLPQNTRNISGDSCKLELEGRFDTCIVFRILAVVKAMVKLVLADAIAHQNLIEDKNLTLSDLRESIDKLDEDILLALYRRQKLAEKIGLLKQTENMRIEDKEREKELLKKIRKIGDTYSLNPEFISSLWKLIISESKRVQ